MSFRYEIKVCFGILDSILCVQLSKLSISISSLRRTKANENLAEQNKCHWMTYTIVSPCNISPQNTDDKYVSKAALSNWTDEWVTSNRLINCTRVSLGGLWRDVGSHSLFRFEDIFAHDAALKPITLNDATHKLSRKKLLEYPVAAVAAGTEEAARAH